jgi:heat-inducible transcriptional repressor
VIIEGQGKLLEAVARSWDPDQMQKLQGLFAALEEKQTILDLLSRTAQAERIQVFIGAETHIEGLSDFTVVATPYGTAREGDSDSPLEALGMVGVIGPTRMNYSRVINLVELTAEIVNGVIGKR